MTALPSGPTKAATLASAGATVRVGLYPRVSEDASGVGRSPKEQEAELRVDADRRGWAVTVVEVDNDRSASRGSAPRPGWRRILAAIDAGAFDILMVWEASRLTRDLEEYVELAKKCRATNTRLYYNGTVFDLNDADDEFRVVLDMGLAQRESGVTRKRIMRAARANAEAGRPHGKRIFGYRRVRDVDTGQLVGQEADEVEAPILAEMFARVLAGTTIYAVVAWLNATIPAPQAATVRKDGRPASGKWSHPTVRRMLANRAYLGHRVHRGSVVVENAWPALVDDDTFYRVQAILTDPARRKSQDVTTKHLLVGLIRCAVCGDRLTFRRGYRRNETQYRCDGGGHVAAAAERLEAGVRLLIAEALARPDALALFDPPEANLSGVRAEHKALLARLDAADDALADGHLEPRAHGELERRLRPRIDELDGKLRLAGRRVPAPVADLAGLTAVEVATRFDALDLTVKRLVVRTLLAECVLRPAPPSRRRSGLGLRFRWAGVGEAVDL